MTLRALVIGAGFAGEGHTTALRKSDVEVVAMCGRTPEPAHAMATKLGIEDVRFDWRKALEEIRPDIVSLATPAPPHQEMAEAAADIGCHIFCDKPLSTSLENTSSMLGVVEKAGVKHAYGSSSRYTPAMRHARALVADGLIGQIREVESIIRFEFPKTTPFSWLHDLSLGGGMLNNALTHVVGQVLYLSKGRITAATGETRYLFGKVPIGDTIHDFRDLFSNPVEINESTEWREADADSGYTLIAQIQGPDSDNISALFQGSAVSRDPNPSYLAIHGEKGSLNIIGTIMTTEIKYCKSGSSDWEQIEIPNDLLVSFPDQDFVQGCWNELFREFVDAIKGQGNVAYPTFYDGWVDSVLIDIARSQIGWQEIPDSTEG